MIEPRIQGSALLRAAAVRGIGVGINDDVKDGDFTARDFELDGIPKKTGSELQFCDPASARLAVLPRPRNTARTTSGTRRLGVFMREVPYERQTVDHPNPVARYAHRARMRRSMRLVRSSLTEPATLLDYGCGQGRFLSELAPLYSGRPITLLGYDPHQNARFEGYRVISDPTEISHFSVDLITSLEVCEHLSTAEMREFVDFAHEILAPHGRLLVSVPIMTGPALLAKELSRTILLRRRTDYAARHLLRAALFGAATPRAEDIKVSHRGFDWRATLDRLRETFVLEHLEFSPLPFKHWYGQSQVIMLFTKP